MVCKFLRLLAYIHNFSRFNLKDYQYDVHQAVFHQGHEDESAKEEKELAINILSNRVP